MKLIQFILLIGILFYADTTDGQTVDTTALDPNLHYINITIRYNSPSIIDLYQSHMVILSEYAVVLASCYLNISTEEISFTSYNTTDLIFVEINSFNFSLIYITFAIRQFSEIADGDTFVMLEFYLTQNGTFILATEAIAVFNMNCDTDNWVDSITSNTISASAIFSSRQTSVSPLSSSLASTSIYTSSLPYMSSLSSPASGISSYLSTYEPTQQVSAPVITSSQILPSSAVEVNTSPTVGTTLVPSTSSARPLVTMTSQSQSVISTDIQQSSYSPSSIRQSISPVSSSIKPPIIRASSSIQPPVTPISSSIKPPIIRASSSIKPPVTPISSSIKPPIIRASSSIQPPVTPISSSIKPPIIRASSSIQPPVTPVSSSIKPPVTPLSSSIKQPVTPVSSSIKPPIIPSSSSLQQPIIRTSIITSRLLASSIIPLSTSSIGAHPFSSVSSSAFYQITSLLSAVHSLTSAVSRILTQTGIIQVSRSLQVPFYSNTSSIVPSETSQLVIPSHSVPQQPSLFFNTSQLTSAHFLSTSTPIDRMISLTTQPLIIPTTTAIQSTVLPSASPIQPTVTPISPYRHYLIGTIEYTVSNLEIGQTDDNINATITAIARRYLNLTTETALAIYTLTTEHISVRIGYLTVTAIRSEYDQFIIENLATRRVVFYLTDHTAPMFATQAKEMLDTHSIDQWADSLGLQTLLVTFDPYLQIQTSFMPSSTFVATMAVSSQLSSSVPISITSAVLSSSATVPSQSVSVSVSSVRLVTSSLIRASQNTTAQHTVLSSLSSQIQQSLPSSSLQSTSLPSISLQSTYLPSISLQPTSLPVTQSSSMPVQLMTSSLISTLVSLSSNRSALSLPATSTPESPVISVTPSLMSVLNSTQPSQPVTRSQIPLSSSGIQTTQAVQPSSAVISSAISSVQQLSSNTTSLPTLATVNSTQFPTSTRSVRVIPSSQFVSRVTTQTPIVSMIRNISSSALSSQINTSSASPTQRDSASHSTVPSINSSLLQSMQTVQSSPLTTPSQDYHSLANFNPGVGYLLQLTLNVSGRMVNLTSDFYLQTELDLINLYSLGLEKESANSRRKRDVFNTTSQIACGIIESLTIIDTDQLIIVFYISREEDSLPLQLIAAERSNAIFDKLDPGNFTATLGYEFLSLSIYKELFVDPHRIAIIVGTTLGCCILVLLIFLLALCLYHCLHSNYIRADKWSPDMSVAYSNKGVSSTKLMNEDEFEMEFTGNFSEGTQTLAGDFLYGSSEITRNSADYAFAMRREPNIFSPFQMEETTRFIDESEINKYPLLEPVPAPTVSQLRTEIEEEKKRAKRAEASLLEIMTSNRKHFANTSMFSDPSEAKRAEERANTAYERSKKEFAVTTGAVTPSSSHDSSLGSSRGAHRPWSGRGNKVAPSNEPTGGLTLQPTPPDWDPDSQQSVSSKGSRSMQLSGFRNVRPPNIMQVEPIQGNGRIPLETPPPSYDTSLVDAHATKPVPVRVFRTDGHPVQMQPSIPSTPVTTATITVLPSFNPFYTTAKEEHTSL